MTDQIEYITKTTAKERYKLSEEDLEKIPCVIKKNPHYKRLKMYLYPKYDIILYTMVKYSIESVEGIDDFFNNR